MNDRVDSSWKLRVWVWFSPVKVEAVWCEIIEDDEGVRSLVLQIWRTEQKAGIGREEGK